MKWLKNFFSELALNGKALLAWIALEIPGLSDYPGVVESLNIYIENPSTQNLINVLWQALFAGAAGHRLIKVLRNIK